MKKNNLRDMAESPEFERLLLNKIELNFNYKLEGHYLQDAELRQFYDYLSDSIVFRFRAFLYGQEKTIEKVVLFPTSWFQMFKQMYFPQWLIQYFPVKTKSFPQITNITKVCPHLNVKSERPHIEFFITKGSL
jgi:hypothetical protein